MRITEEQYKLLVDFFNHCFNVFHNSNADNFSWWAEKLDQNKISWKIQNSVSAIATNKDSKNLYLRSHLSNKGVIFV
ncbi:MAG: hypothetical protein CML20_12580 [Rheinheimera sp.]|jgi:hypothetical protein|nr:hypothetical protein [Rheinheimera sp.]|tara:strand:+ start:24378 stop:24608 length:231 start_codon:yes stop_codon:yes gene_type:complete